MPGISVSKIPIPFNKGGGISWSSYWKTQNVFDFLWMGEVSGNELVDVSGNGNNLVITNNELVTNYIPATSSATFAIPNVAGLKTDDNDKFWADAGGTILQKTAANLVASDMTRTIIKYDNSAPYHVRWIGILKSTVTLTSDQIDKLHQSFLLWLFWSGSLNAYGVIKANRVIVPMPDIMTDGNSLFFLDYKTNVTQSSFKVSAWADYFGNGISVDQGTAGNRPTVGASSIVFNRANTEFLYKDALGIKQPTSIYAVMKYTQYIRSYLISPPLISTNGSLKIDLGDVVPQLRISAGVNSDVNVNLALNTWGIVRIVFNGAGSKFQIDETAAWTGNAGLGDMGGISIGALSGGTQRPSSIEMRGLLLRKIVDTDENSDAIHDYLKARYAL